ncbi:MAG TPA: hypothetical protein VMN04_08040, partial [Thermoanaerobaculia bacterium]|nr:hypothetical protein [Thermoanaerobaculia bacterium]
MSAPSAERETPAWAALFPALALAVWLAQQLRTWFVRDFTHDDFYFAYLSWLRAVRARPGVDVDALLYTPLVEIFGPVFRLRPESFLGLYAGRALILVVALALLSLVYVLSRRLGADPPWALGAVCIAAWQGDFLLRIGDVRTDPIATLFLLLALGLLVAPDEARLLPAGLCFGTAVYFNIKLAVAVPALGLAVALVSRRAVLLGLLRFGAGGALATLVWDGLRSLSDGWGPIAGGLRALLAAPPTGSVPVVTDFLRRAVAAAPGAGVLLVLGAAGTLAAPFLTPGREGFAGAARDPRFVYGSAAIVFVAVFLRANPYLFP